MSPVIVGWSSFPTSSTHLENFTSGYHPEADGQTEQVNQTLEQYLWIYSTYQQDNWAPLLPIAKFAYNNAPNASISITPFFANKGYHPSLQ